MVTGGVRSGKSAYAQQLSLTLSDRPFYIATARHWDHDFTQRIARHQKDRMGRWEVLEEEKYISKHKLAGQTIVIDCVTLWLTNFFSDLSHQVTLAMEEAKKEFDVFVSQSATFIFITNEIGMGGHAETEMGRKFADLQGWMNQYIAQKSDQVTCMVSGIPMKIKP